MRILLTLGRRNNMNLSGHHPGREKQTPEMSVQRLKNRALCSCRCLHLRLQGVHLFELVDLHAAAERAVEELSQKALPRQSTTHAELSLKIPKNLKAK